MRRRLGGQEQEVKGEGGEGSGSSSSLLRLSVEASRLAVLFLNHSEAETIPEGQHRRGTAVEDVPPVLPQTTDPHENPHRRTPTRLVLIGLVCPVLVAAWKQNMRSEQRKIRSLGANLHGGSFTIEWTRALT